MTAVGLQNAKKDSSRFEHISGRGNRAPDFEPVGQRTLCGVREYFLVRRIDLPVEGKDRVGKRSLRLLQSQRRPAISVSGQASIASSLRCAGDRFRSSRERAAGIPPVG